VLIQHCGTLDPSDPEVVIVPSAAHKIRLLPQDTVTFKAPIVTVVVAVQLPSAPLAAVATTVYVPGP
jgi:hypothetical protein